MTAKADFRAISVWSTPLAMFLFPLFGLYLPNGLVVVLSIAAFIRLIELIAARRMPAAPGSVLTYTAALGVWAAVSALWALDAGFAVKGAVSVLLLTLALHLVLDAAVIFSLAERRRIGWAFLAGTLSAALCLTFESFSGAAIAAFIRNYDLSDHFQAELAVRSLNRGVSFLALTLPLTVLCVQKLTRKRLAAIAAALLLGALTAGWGKDALLASLIAMTAMAGAFHLSRRRAAWALSVVIVLSLAAAPFAALRLPDPQTIRQEWNVVPHSLQHRLFIWNFSSQKIFERPLLGWGMNSSKFIPGGDQDVVVGTGLDQLTWRSLPLHPHNAVIQWWLELGAAGTILAGAVLFAAVAALRRCPERRDRAAAAAVFAAAAAMSLSSFGAWQSWWLAGMAAAVWLFQILRDDQPAAPKVT